MKLESLLLILVVMIQIGSACSRKSMPDNAVSTGAPLNITVGKALEGWKETERNGNHHYTSSDGKFFIFVIQKKDEGIQTILDKVNALGTNSKLSVDSVQDTTISGKAGKVIALTSQEDGIKMEVNVVEVSGRTVKIGTAYPVEETDFLTDQWKEFLEGISFSAE